MQTIKICHFCGRHESKEMEDLKSKLTSLQQLLGSCKEVIKPFANCWIAASEKNKIVELPFGYYAKAQELLTLLEKEGVK